MIKNEQQYRLTKAQATKFANAIDTYSKSVSRDMNPIRIKAHMDALRSQYEELNGEVAEYEKLKQGEVKSFVINSFDELPTTLIKARIASGLSQKDLADLLEIKEQQIQRYEANSYAGASFERLKETIKALKLTVKEHVFVSEEVISRANFFKNLADLGFKKDVVLKRLIPKKIAAYLDGSMAVNEVDTLPYVLQAASIVSKIFNINSESLLSKNSLEIDLSSAYSTRFKKPKDADIKKIAPYTIYAQVLALTLLEACKHIEAKTIPTDVKDFRNQVIENYGSISFETALKYTWSLGIPVLPLDDSKNFHGACWRVKGRNVIVLKQKTKSSVRWLFDLIHEVRHASQHIESPTLDIIEGEDDFSKEMARSIDEKDANIFAGQVILNCKANDLSQRVIKEANGKVELLKKVTQQVAHEEDVEVGALANYIAFRLMAEQGFNWWGNATNLQPEDGSHWIVAKQLLFKNVNLNELPETEKELLINALE
ncbi:helix-turn-helix domain-containing protein [Spirosoma sp. HMF4905]|uniref:Helix-turn-helix domain-containing protein n=1 Tax=Spirosoma arboris TaxID=2682092 RepID=A0A7K1SPF1_9BACT|nr:helix-turn-helix transcriptional regulator [Spirosoma arboris]MVM35679.1 helix-turn-helix domain-containing protein [Spirosoma arboris]